MIGGYDAVRKILQPRFNYLKLEEVTRVITENLNNIIDVNYYPIEEAERSNRRHRPIGIGVQGLADAFVKMNMAYSSQDAVDMNRDIFETIYYAAVDASCDLAIRDGPYSTFKGSPASKGILQFDMWDVTPSKRYDWEALKQKVIKHGMRNSLLVAPMPTASTSQILGNNECFEPFTSNIYSRRTNAGEFVLVNKFLMKELQDQKLWTDELKNNIIANKGSIQHLDFLPVEMREKVQDRVGNPHETHDRYGERQRGIHMPEPKPEPMARKPRLQEADFDAHVVMEARVEDGYILSSPQGKASAAAVHGRTEEGTSRRGGRGRLRNVRLMTP